jgi:hypothetical protein
MPRYEKVDARVKELALEVLTKHDTHKPLLEAKLKIGYLFALPGVDEDGNPVGDAIRHHGQKATGLARIINLRDRTAGREDCEVLLDKTAWEDMDEKQKLALLDHELHHFDIRIDNDGAVLRDDLGRPRLRMRQHDVEFGWFKLVAQRNGASSQERIQAASMMEHSGQYFWPDLAPNKK